jgi:DNA-binding IclR family transcriptional regulator
MATGQDDGFDAELTAAHIYRVPIIDKMMEIFTLLEQGPDQEPRIAHIVAETRLSRSTVYRILNTLVHHGLVHRTSDGGYRLGLRLKGLAASVTINLTLEDMLATVRPALKVLSDRTRATSKFTILDQSLAKVVALEIGSDPFAPTSRLGSTFDLHAGAASKLLLAHAPAAERKAVFNNPLARHTDTTIVERADLEAELATIRATGISFDRGEWSGNVHAVAAPIMGPGSEVLGALSVTYFPKPDEAQFLLHVTPILREVASDVSEQLARGITTMPSPILT